MYAAAVHKLVCKNVYTCTYAYMHTSYPGSACTQNQNPKPITKHCSHNYMYIIIDPVQPVHPYIGNPARRVAG